MPEVSSPTADVQFRTTVARRLLPVAMGLSAFLALGGAQSLAAQGRAPRAGETLVASREAASPTVAARLPGPGLTIQSASPHYGIEGRLEVGGASIAFMSRTVPEGVLASIVDARGTSLYEYREFKGETIRVEGRDGVRIVLPRAPEIRIGGLLYGASNAEQTEALQALANSREGKLIRRLGLELLAAAPSRTLKLERMGLELATQALWPHFRSATSAAAYPFTEDYEVNASGYVVHAQPEDLVLANNYLHAGLPWEKHNDGAVGDCFGRCGQGCTGGFAFLDLWPSSWTDTVGSAYPAHQEVHCVSGEDWIYNWYATPTTHSVSGTWSPGCQLHDNCCRLNVLLCLTYCNYLVPVVAADLLIDSETRTWSYTDTSWSITSYNAGFSGCTCPGVNPYSDFFECVEGQ